MAAIRSGSAVTLVVLASAFFQVQAAAPPVDKAKLEAYLRYAEGFTPRVTMSIDDPVKSSVPGYYRLRVHLSMGETKQEKTYFLSEDGSKITSGPVWDLNTNPFTEAAPSVPVDGPAFGPAGAPITLVVFSDFQCPYCREFASTVRSKLRGAFPTQVRVIFKDFPLESIHPWALQASEGAACLAQANSELFWEFHDWIFQHQGEITKENIKDRVLVFAKEHGGDVSQIQSCIETRATQRVVENSIAEGRKLDISQTPTFFLNGRMIPGSVSWESLQALVNMELYRPAFIPSAKSETPDKSGIAR